MAVKDMLSVFSAHISAWTGLLAVGSPSHFPGCGIPTLHPQTSNRAALQTTCNHAGISRFCRVSQAGVLHQQQQQQVSAAAAAARKTAARTAMQLLPQCCCVAGSDTATIAVVGSPAALPNRHPPAAARRPPLSQRCRHVAAAAAAKVAAPAGAGRQLNFNNCLDKKHEGKALR